MKSKKEHSFKVLSGAEIETLADYLGQGSLGVRYSYGFRQQDYRFHSIPKAYDNTIARARNETSELGMTTDSNRSEEKIGFPMRTCIEFRSGPEKEKTESLLLLLKAYSDWIELQKVLIRNTHYVDYHQPKRNEIQSHFVSLQAFIQYYNGLPETIEPLILSAPSTEFHSTNAGPEFAYDFPENAEWVIRFEYEDLVENEPVVFYAQYNLSIPIGYVFDPQIREIFPLQKEFHLLTKEKEIAPDFNESRPHTSLRAYEAQIFSSAIAMADHYFLQIQAPDYALGLKDFLRGMAFEVAMISTGEQTLSQLFEEEALWILEHQSDTSKNPQKELSDYKINLLDTLRKSLFSYFMKTTLSQVFKNLHPYEQHLLLQIPKSSIRQYYLESIQLANDGQKQPSYFAPNGENMLKLFNIFYAQTFLRKEVEGEYPVDPIGWLTRRLIDPQNISLSKTPIPAVVLEVRQPEQGNQQYSAIETLCSTYTTQLERFLKKVVPVLTESRHQLDSAWILSQPHQNKPPSSSARIIKALKKEKTRETFSMKESEEKTASNKRKRDNYENGKTYTKSDLWVSAKSYRIEKPVSSRTRFAQMK